ncbi:MAG: TetR family transcriptional regulator [bacterium]
MDMRQQILAEATRLFAARGFDGTSLQDISDAVGIRKPSLLYHFSSKVELRRGVLERLLAHWQDVLPRLLLAATSGFRRFDAIARELVSFFTENPDRARLLIREALDRPEELRESILVHVSPWVKVVCDNIRTGQEQGTIHGDVDPEAYVTHIIALVISSVATFDTIGAVIRPQDEADAPARQQHVRHVTELLRMARSSLFVGDRAARPAKQNGSISRASEDGQAR